MEALENQRALPGDSLVDTAVAIDVEKSTAAEVRRRELDVWETAGPLLRELGGC